MDHQYKEAVIMNFKNILFFLSLAIALTSFNVYAIDQSICIPGANVALHNNGSLKSCELKDNYESNDIRCSKGRVSFYPNGNLESCMLDHPITFGENKCAPYSLIFFYPDGRLKSCMKPGN